MLKFLHAEHHILVPTSHPHGLLQGTGSTGVAPPIQVGQRGGANYSEVKDVKRIFLGFSLGFSPPRSFLSQRS